MQFLPFLLHFYHFPKTNLKLWFHSYFTCTCFHPSYWLNYINWHTLLITFISSIINKTFLCVGEYQWSSLSFAAWLHGFKSHSASGTWLHDPIPSFDAPHMVTSLHATSPLYNLWPLFNLFLDFLTHLITPVASEFAKMSDSN